VSQLLVEALDVYYGAVHALKGVSLRVEAGEIVTLIGANGAGKTTLLRTISGIVPARAGRVSFEGKDITKLPAHEIVGLGVSQSPEGRMVFANLSVEDNLELGAYRRRDRDGIKKDYEKVFQLFPRLRERRRQLSGTLSGGEQQMLAMGRALMSPAAAAAAGRTLARHRAAPGARHLQDHRRDQPCGDDGACSSSRTRTWR
jgi:branched-chain amino acid transport system ATP-binding protein